eukprot:403347823
MRKTTQLPISHFDTMEEEPHNIHHETFNTSYSSLQNRSLNRSIKHHEISDNMGASDQDALSDSDNFTTFQKIHHRTGKPDKRRDDDLYTPELCKFADTEKCPKKDKCRRAHNRVERLYHKDKYKTKFCHCYPNKIQQCEYGDYCSFAHSVEDIKVRLIHHLLPSNQDYDFYIFYFKTEWCPFNHEHNKAQCVYAHNFQDFRRKPNLFRYDTELCEDWQSGTFITCYEEGCKRLEKCSFSHGWKEQQFHPLVYKTLPCEEQKCFKGYECPFYHSSKDKRVLDKIEAAPRGASMLNKLQQQQITTQEYVDKLFTAKERNFKCPQQPGLMQLFFDNNLNHLKELEVLEKIQGNHSIDRFVLYNDQQPINIKRSSKEQNASTRACNNIKCQNSASSQQARDSSFEITHRTNIKGNHSDNCTCLPQNVEKLFSQHTKNQEDLTGRQEQILNPERPVIQKIFNNQSVDLHRQLQKIDESLIEKQNIKSMEPQQKQEVLNSDKDRFKSDSIVGTVQDNQLRSPQFFHQQARVKPEAQESHFREDSKEFIPLKQIQSQVKRQTTPLNKEAQSFYPTTRHYDSDSKQFLQSPNVRNNLLNQNQNDLQSQFSPPPGLVLQQRQMSQQLGLGSQLTPQQQQLKQLSNQQSALNQGLMGLPQLSHSHSYQPLSDANLLYRQQLAQERQLQQLNLMNTLAQNRYESTPLQNQLFRQQMMAQYTPEQLMRGSGGSQSLSNVDLSQYSQPKQYNTNLQSRATGPQQQQQSSQIQSSSQQNMQEKELDQQKESQQKPTIQRKLTYDQLNQANLLSQGGKQQSSTSQDKPTPTRKTTQDYQSQQLIENPYSQQDQLSTQCDSQQLAYQQYMLRQQQQLRQQQLFQQHQLQQQLLYQQQQQQLRIMGLNSNNPFLLQQSLIDPGFGGAAFGGGFDNLGFMMKSCPPPTSKKDNDSFYSEKLQNFADSYKKLNLEFNDIQEDDLENSENQKILSRGSAGTFGAGSGKGGMFNIEKSLGHLGLNDSFNQKEANKTAAQTTYDPKSQDIAQNEHEMSPFSQKLQAQINDHILGTDPREFESPNQTQILQKNQDQQIQQQQLPKNIQEIPQTLKSSGQLQQQQQPLAKDSFEQAVSGLNITNNDKQ